MHLQDIIQPAQMGSVDPWRQRLEKRAGQVQDLIGQARLLDLERQFLDELRLGHAHPVVGPRIHLLALDSFGTVCSTQPIF